MGTSTPFGGGNGRNPLIPSWLGDGGAPLAPAGPAAPPAAPAFPGSPLPHSPAPGATLQSPSSPASPPSDLPTPVEPVLSPFDQRFRAPRTSFNKFARSGGSDKRNLAKALSSYMSRTGGGSKTAARRMASDRRAAQKLGGILAHASASGIREVIRTLSLDALADRSVAEIYAALVDVVCAPGGDLDEAFPRDAYLEAVAEIMDMNLDDIEKPSSETVALIMERFIGNTIHNRILNAIGNGLVTLPDSIASVKAIEKSLREFVRGAVSDALSEIGRVFDSSQMKPIIDGVYERSLAILQVHADQAAGGKP